MPKINCDAKTCTHNSDNGCCLHGISVAGSDASHSGETCCDSFKEIRHDKSVTLDSCDNARIDCEAKKCSYNISGGCAAVNVDVCGCDACNCGETECKTFIKD